MSAEDSDAQGSEDVDGIPITEEKKEEQFNLSVALSALANDNPELIAKLERGENELTAMRQNIISQSRRNFILEKELNEIDEKIKLLIKNRIKQEEISLASTEENHTKAESPLQGKRHLYEELFYLLQSRTQYFAQLARLVPNKHHHIFVQTVVFDMYGDQYDTREERLLLDLFRKVLRAELAATTNKGSLLRNNTAITQMLSAYSKRGSGLSILKEILEAPLKEITSRKDLNLEVEPVKIYNQVITDYETKTGKKSDLPRDPTTEVAAANEEVRAIVAQRMRDLEHYCELILTRIVDAVDKIPYGMRWVCKQLGVLCKEKFPDVDKIQIASVIGGYIFLRFFNPAIVTPDAINLISTKPSRICRRNLTVIAGVIQTLSNGLLYGDRATHMKALNPFVKRHMETLQHYFDKLTSVDDLADALQLDRYLEHTNVRMNMINVSFNQIFLIHQLLLQHVDTVAPDPRDQIRAVLKNLGAAPNELPKAENRTIALQLLDRRKDRLSTQVDAFAAPQVNGLYLQAKTLLLSVLKLLPFETSQTQLLAFLEEQKQAAIRANDDSLADHISNVISMLHALADMGLLKTMPDIDTTFNNFLWEIATEAVDRNNRLAAMQKRLEKVSSALKSIETHHKYLQQRLALYKEYLENVRKGNQMEIPAKSTKKKLTKLKFMHTELEEMGVIESTHPSVDKSVLKRCYYIFENVAPGRFEITLYMKRGMDIKLLNKPIVLVLDELLKMQEHNELSLDLESVKLNVNLLIHLLNTKFILD